MSTVEKVEGRDYKVTVVRPRYYEPVLGEYVDGQPYCVFERLPYRIIDPCDLPNSSLPSEEIIDSESQTVCIGTLGELGRSEGSRAANFKMDDGPQLSPPPDLGCSASVFPPGVDVRAPLILESNLLELKDDKEEIADLVV